MKCIIIVVPPWGPRRRKGEVDANFYWCQWVNGRITPPTVRPYNSSPAHHKSFYGNVGVRGLQQYVLMTYGFLVGNLLVALFSPSVYVKRLFNINRREWKRLKGCVFSPPSVCPIPARGREARQRNPSIDSIPTPVQSLKHKWLHFIMRRAFSI